MGESRGFEGVHGGCFPPFFFGKCLTYLRVYAQNMDFVIHWEYLPGKWNGQLFNEREDSLCRDLRNTHCCTQKDNISLCHGNKIFPAISVTPVKKAILQWHEWRKKTRGMLLHFQTQGSWRISPSICVIDRCYISEIFNILHRSLLWLYFQQLL